VILSTNARLSRAAQLSQPARTAERRNRGPKARGITGTDERLLEDDLRDVKLTVG